MEKETKTKSTKQSSNNGEDILYKLDGRPPLLLALPVSLQHILAMFTGNIAPILIICGVVGNVTDADQLLLMQAAMLMSGLATIFQAFPIKIGKFQIGSGMPMVMGSAFAFVPAMSTAAGNYGIGAIFGASLIAGIAAVLMGVFIKQLKQFFPPVVVGSVLVAIGLNLLPTGAKYFAGGVGSENYGGWQNLLVGFVVFLIITIINCVGKGMLKNVGLLLGIIVGYILAVCLGMVDFTPIREASWFGFVRPLHFTPIFHIDSIISFAVIFLVTGLENLGNLSGITNGIFDREPTTQESSGGIIGGAIFSQIGSLFGSFPSAVFGQNTGIVLMTKIVNRFCFILAGGIMVATSFMPKIAALFSSMPQSVLGGAIITVFAMILLNGIKMLAKDGFGPRNSLVISVTFGFGYALGNVLNTALVIPDVSGLPGFLAVIVSGLFTVIKFIFSDSVTAVCVISIIANLLIPGRKADVKRREEEELVKQQKLEQARAKQS